MKGELIRRHSLVVRVTHWVQAAAIVLLIGTGLNIFNAYPRLHWGQAGANADAAVLSIEARRGADGEVRGVLQIGDRVWTTTGVLGLSRADGAWQARAWPAAVTIPSWQDLASARRWHLFAAWVLGLNLLAYLLWSAASRHLQRDLWPTAGDLRAIPRSVWDHLRLRHPHGEAARRYNVLQRLAYLAVILLVAGMIFTGLGMSPGVNAAAPWMLDVLGGRQSARTLHFICTGLIVVFIAVHVAEVLLSGPLNQLRGMITGRWRLPPERPR